MRLLRFYFKNPLFIIGFTLWAIGTILGGFKLIGAGVAIESIGIIMIIISVYSLEKKSILKMK